MLTELRIKTYTNIPPRTTLYNIEPIGLGTPYVESLRSYIARLASNHCVRTGDLIKYVISKEMNIDTNYFFYSSSFINKFGNDTDNLIFALEKLTSREDLKLLTISKWQSAFVNPNGTFHKTPRWCPLCFEDLRKSNEEIYEPLIWSLKCIQICPRHSISLSSVCHHCEKVPYSFSSNSRPGYCTKCENWLGNATKLTEMDSPELEWCLFIVKEIGRILSSTSVEEKSVSNEKITKTIAKIVGITANGNGKEFAKLINRTPRLVYKWRFGKAQPAIDSIIAICSVAKISLIDLLLNRLDYNQINQVWESNEKKLEISSVDIKKVNERIDYTDLEMKLEDIYLNEYPPPTVKQLQIRFNYHNIYRKFPLLSKKIISKYRDYQITQREKNLKKRCDEVRRITMELVNQLEYPTVSKVRNLMGNPVGFRDPVIRQTYENTLIELKAKRNNSLNK